MFRVIRSSLGATITHNPMSSRHRVMPLREYCRVPRQGDDDRSGRQPSCLRRMSVIADTSPRGGMRPLSYTVTNTIPSCMPSWYRNAIHMSYVHVWKQRYRLRHAGIIPWSTTASHGRYPGIRQAASMPRTPHAHRTVCETQTTTRRVIIPAHPPSGRRISGAVLEFDVPIGVRLRIVAVRRGEGVADARSLPTGMPHVMHHASVME